MFALPLTPTSPTAVPSIAPLTSVPVTSGAAPALTLPSRAKPAVAEPDHVMSAWATPAARTSDVVVRRMRLVYDTFELK